MRTKIYIKIIKDQKLRDKIEKKIKIKIMRIKNKNKMTGLWLGHHEFQ